MVTVKLNCAEEYEKQKEMYTATAKKDISRASKFQKHLSDQLQKNGVMDQGKNRKQYNQ